MTIQPVTHTYAHNKYECSPQKDDFDLLLETSVKAATPASQIQDDEALKSVELSNGKRRSRRSQNHCTFLRPFLIIFFASI